MIRWLLLTLALVPAFGHAQSPGSHGLFDRAQDVAAFPGYGTANPPAGDLRLFGWVAGSADQTAVMRRALDALSGGGEVVIPYSSGCTVLGALTIDVPVTIRGEGGPLGQGTICAATGSTTVFDVTAPLVTIRDLAFKPLAAGTKQGAGSFIKVEATAHRFRLRDVTLSDFHEGVTLAGGNATTEISGLRAFIYTTGGTQTTACVHVLGGGVDIRISQIICNGPGTGNVEVKAGLWVENAGDIILSDFQLIGMGVDLLVTPGNGQSVTSMWAVNGYLDTAYRGAEFTPSGTGAIARNRLSNVWSSSHTTQGIVVNGGDGLDIDAPHLFLNGAHGLWLHGGTNTRVRGGQIAQNGDNGIYAETSSWSAEGVTIGPTGGLGGNTSYALYTGGGALSNIRFMNNVVSGNGAGAIAFNGVGGSGNVIINNLGASGSQGVMSVGAADSGGTGYRLLRVPN